MLIILIIHHLILSAPCIERYCQTRAHSLDGNGSSYLLYCTFWKFLLVHDPLHKVNPASHIVQWSGHLHSVQLSTPQDAGKRIYEYNRYLLMFYRITMLYEILIFSHFLHNAKTVVIKFSRLHSFTYIHTFPGLKDWRKYHQFWESGFHDWRKYLH